MHFMFEIRLSIYLVFKRLSYVLVLSLEVEMMTKFLVDKVCLEYIHTKR
jgi:hypothetical protein